MKKIIKIFGICLLMFSLFACSNKRIEDYTKEITINKTNLKEYFEIIDLGIEETPDKETKYMHTWGIRSKLYDDGYIYLGADKLFNAIADDVPYSVFEQLLSFECQTMGNDLTHLNTTPEYIDIVPEVSLKFVSKDYIKSYSSNEDNDWQDVTITLLNGDVINRHQYYYYPY